MLLAATQGNSHLSPYTDHSRCLDTHHLSYSSYRHHKCNMPRETHGNNPNLTAATCTETTNSLQCHFSSFYLPPRYETPILNVNISLDMANLQTVNITTLHFCIWQHIGRNRSEAQLQHLATIPSIPVHKVYQHLLNSSL